MTETRARHRVTIKDVARAASVSVTTASEALNGKKRVAEKTRLRVQRVAEELGFSASRSARSLHAGRTGALVLAVAPLQTGVDSDRHRAEWDIEFYVQILSGASARAFQRGYLLAMVPFETSSHAFLEATDGLIVVDPSDEEPLLDAVAHRQLPCVTVGRNTRSLSWVDNDFQTATREALQHLSSLSTGRPALFLTETSSLYVRDELSAYLDWCFETGVEPVIIRAPGPGLEDAEPVIREALRGSERKFDSVVTTLDTLALATERAANDTELAVPEQLQILSLADSRYLAVGFPASITALDLKPAELGAIAVDTIVDEIEDGRSPSQQLVVASLAKRESTLAKV